MVKYLLRVTKLKRVSLITTFSTTNKNQRAAVSHIQVFYNSVFSRFPPTLPPGRTDVKSVQPAEEAEVFSNHKSTLFSVVRLLLYGLHGLILSSPSRYSVGYWLHESRKFSPKSHSKNKLVYRNQHFPSRRPEGGCWIRS